MMAYQLDFLPVGDSNGDAICIRYGSPDAFYVHVVDGGYDKTSETVIDHIEQHYFRTGIIHHVVLSHADGDHSAGLVGVLEHFDVGALWMNRPWLYSAEIIHAFHLNWTEAGLTKYIRDSYPRLVKLEEIANRKGIPICEAFQGARIGEFTVLAPSRARYLRLIPDLDKTPQSYLEYKGLAGGLLETIKMPLDAAKEAWDIETLDNDPPPTSASNETSVIQMANFDGKRILLTADVGPEGLNEAAHYAIEAGLFGQLSLVQVPHHGSRRNVTPNVLNTWLGNSLAQANAKVGDAACSVGKDADIYPRKKVKNAFTRRGYPVYSTKGRTVLFNTGWSRDGWTAVEPEPFSHDVED